MTHWAAGFRAATAEADDRSGRSRGLRLRVQLQHALCVPVGGAVQADRIPAKHRRLTVARDAIRAVGDSRPAGATDDPFPAAGQLLGFDAGEERPPTDALMHWRSGV